MLLTKNIKHVKIIAELNKFTQCVVYAVRVYAVKRESGENPERNCRCMRLREYVVTKVGH